LCSDFADFAAGSDNLPAESGQSMSASKSKSQVESDLDLARERLSFYEQFDEIIKQNIASSSALLKEASARLDSDIAAERSRYRTLLSEILADLTALQSQSEKLARRVIDALDEIEGAAVQSVERVAPETAALGLNTAAPPEAAAVVNAAAGRTPKSAGEAVEVDAVAAVPTETVTASTANSAPVIHAIAPDFSKSATTTLLVHGVPRASAALGLKSYIEKLDFVSTVEPLELGDLSGWNLADRVQLRTAANELLEVDLAPA
jgi:hypothetical protein